MAASPDFPLDLVRVRQLEAALAAAVERRVPGGQWRSVPDPRRLLGKPWPLLTVAARHPGFGSLELQLDGDQGYQVQLGRFTHVHFDRDEDPDPAALARRAAELAARVLEDQVLCFETWRGGGSRLRSAPESWLSRLLRKGPLWVWSGPLPDGQG